MNINTFEKLIEITQNKDKKIYEICQENEANEMSISTDEFRLKVKKNIVSMKEAIKIGLLSNQPSSSRLSGIDCNKLKRQFETQGSFFSKLHQKALLYSLSTAEENARMGKIVACPTAGACGIVPGCIISTAEEFGLNEENEINALITSGCIGKIISTKMSLAGAVMGCQGECGVASGMASGAIVELLGGNVNQIINACALTLKNIMGLVCDPVAGLVEVPCVKRNAFLAINAFVGAQIAMSNIKSVIPLDEVIDAIKQVGELMSPSLKENSEAGLSATKTGLKIYDNLKIKWKSDAV